MKKLFLVGACLVALASQPVQAQAGGETDVVVVQVDYSAGGKIIIVRPGGKTEEIELNRGLRGKGLTEGGITLQRVFTQLAQEGYTIKSTFTGASIHTSTLIFMKDK